MIYNPTPEAKIKDSLHKSSKHQSVSFGLHYTKKLTPNCGKIHREGGKYQAQSDVRPSLLGM